MHTPLLPSSNGGYRPSIDGLRAVAVLAVFFFHLYPSLLPGGFLGVDVFFVISGYLITGIILREQVAGAFSFTRFYARRVKRIFPALFATLLLSAVFAILLLRPESYLNFMKSAHRASAQLANFFFARSVGYFEEGFAAQPLLHTWSLGVEEQFYLFWPLLIVLFPLALGRMRRDAGSTLATGDNLSCDTRAIAGLFLVLTALSFLACFVLAAIRENTAFYMFYTRAWEFSLGGLAALPANPRGQRISLTGPWGQLVAAVTLAASLLFVGRDFLGASFLRLGVIFPCLGTALLLHASNRDSLVNRVLASPPLAFVGRISYSLYLYHWPLITFSKHYGNTNELTAPAAILIVAAAFVLATLSYHWIEQPARRTAWPDRTVLALGAAAIIAGIVTFNNLDHLSQASWRISRYDDSATRPARGVPLSCQGADLGKDTHREGITQYACRTSRNPLAPVIALVGDSHAPHFLPAATTWAKKNGYNVKFLGVPGCPMLDNEITMESRIDPGHAEQCKNAHPLFRSEFLDNPQVKIILLAQRFDLFYNGQGYSSPVKQIIFKDANGSAIENHTYYYRRQLAHTIETIRAKGKEPVLLKQVPILGGMGDCEWQPMLKKLLGAQRECAFDEGFIRTWQQPSIDFIDAFASEHRIKTFDPFPALPSPLHGHVSLYANNDHLNAHGFQQLIPLFLRAMEDLGLGGNTVKKETIAP